MRISDLYMVLAVLAATAFLVSFLIADEKRNMVKVKMMPLGWFFLALISIIRYGRGLGS